ncbi:hypothetical protein L2E82_39835 [Cichorium intybus]|uniref:Uncharacterized protein n=1 Tax=Cichorium intybus TaxID=13427 RepID=A0ACB9AIM7_CICIN|nr:hypothetical protein L2E82_39835 [Cichorium intybus]
MSANSSIVIRAPLKLWISSALLICSFWCSSQNRFLFSSCTVSMPLRPKRISSGVNSFGRFHIDRYLNFFVLAAVTQNQRSKAVVNSSNTTSYLLSMIPESVTGGYCLPSNFFFFVLSKKQWEMISGIILRFLCLPFYSQIKKSKEHEPSMVNEFSSSNKRPDLCPGHLHQGRWYLVESFGPETMLQRISSEVFASSEEHHKTVAELMTTLVFDLERRQQRLTKSHLHIVLLCNLRLRQLMKLLLSDKHFVFTPHHTVGTQAMEIIMEELTYDKNIKNFAGESYVASTENKEDIADNSLPEICKSMISAFTCLKKNRSVLLSFT